MAFTIAFAFVPIGLLLLWRRQRKNAAGIMKKIDEALANARQEQDPDRSFDIVRAKHETRH
jgi:hypothetical protein